MLVNYGKFFLRNIIGLCDHSRYDFACIDCCFVNAAGLTGVKIERITFVVDAVNFLATGVCYVKLENSKVAKDAARRFNWKEMAGRTVHGIDYIYKKLTYLDTLTAHLRE